jgi:hypothetical protein
LFESDDVLLSAFGKKTGRLVYWYKSVPEAKRESTFDGVVSLSWTRKHPGELLKSMSGWYVSSGKGGIGRIYYERISKEKFEAVERRIATGAQIP